MAIIKTIIKVPSIDGVYNVPGAFTAAQVQSMYSSQIPGLANMTATSVTLQTPEGEVSEITFAPRSGNKG